MYVIEKCSDFKIEKISLYTHQTSVRVRFVLDDMVREAILELKNHVAVEAVNNCNQLTYEFLKILVNGRGLRTLQTNMECFTEYYVRTINNSYGKYKWHNLKKNPDDLPKISKSYLIAVKNLDSKYIQYKVDNYDSEEYLFEDYFKKEVIGWKEIERFEE